MAKRSKISVVFFLLLILSILLFILSKANLLNGPQSILAKTLSPFQSASFSAFNFLTSGSSDIKRLQSENRDLLGKLIDQDKLIKDNNALRDQFERSGEERLQLLPARIVGAPSFVPGVTDPLNFIINKGKNDTVKKGSAVVIKNILVGKVISVSDYFSKVEILTNPSFTALVRNQRSGANGVIEGDGEGQLILDNVLQADDVKTSDILVTKGSQDLSGAGFPPDLIVGKVMSIEKKPSEVFQKGKVQSPLDFSDISTVFVVAY